MSIVIGLYLVLFTEHWFVGILVILLLRGRGVDKHEETNEEKVTLVK